jgi:hypothetical protein
MLGTPSVARVNQILKRAAHSDFAIAGQASRRYAQPFSSWSLVAAKNQRKSVTMNKLIWLSLACMVLLNGCITVDRRDDHRDQRRERYDECRRNHDARYCNDWRS